MCVASTIKQHEPYHDNCYYVGQLFDFYAGGVTDFSELQRVCRDYIWIGAILHTLLW